MFISLACIQTLLNINNFQYFLYLQYYISMKQEQIQGFMDFGSEVNAIRLQFTKK